MLNIIKEDYDFSCWVIKYGCVSIMGKIYKKDSLKSSDGIRVPLIWNHIHEDPVMVLGHAFLENRDEGIYVYGKLTNESNKELIKQIIRDRGKVSMSPYINRVKCDGKYITDGLIREVSFVEARVDPDESYYPVLKEI